MKDEAIRKFCVSVFLIVLALISPALGYDGMVWIFGQLGYTYDEYEIVGVMSFAGGFLAFIVCAVTAVFSTIDAIVTQWPEAKGWIP